jgi:hypothetical protein
MSICANSNSHRGFSPVVEHCLLSLFNRFNGLAAGSNDVSGKPLRRLRFGV